MVNKAFLKKELAHLRMSGLCKILVGALLLGLVPFNVRGETLTIAVPYLPKEINLLETQEPVHRLIIANLSSPLLATQDSKNSCSASKAIRLDIENKTEQIWELSFPKGAPLSEDTVFGPNVLTSAVDLLQLLSVKAQESEDPAKKSRGKLVDHETNEINTIQNIDQGGQKSSSSENYLPIDLISKLEIIDTENSFRAVFRIVDPNIDFLKKFAAMPILIDYELANVFGVEQIGRGTNFPFLGPYQVAEYRSNEQAILKSRRSFGYPGEQSIMDTVVLKVYKDQIAAMRALRSGTVSMIFLPSEFQIRDASRDATLRLIESPIEASPNMHDSLIITSWIDETTVSPTQPAADLSLIDTSKIITRRSLDVPSSFMRALEFMDISQEK